MTLTTDTSKPAKVSPSSSSSSTPCPTTPTKLEYPNARSVPFPYERPYAQQIALMDALLQGISSTTSKTRILCLESPTGTGKSLSLACSSLAWLDFIQQKDREEASRPISNLSAATSGIDWIDSWQEPESKLQQQSEQLYQREQQLSAELQTLRSQFDNQPQAQQRRENILRQAMTKLHVQAKKNKRRWRQHKKPLEYESDPDSGPTIGSPEWLLAPSPRRQVIYAARTHSQLAQFVAEVRKTKWGRTVRVVTLSSRSQGLCGHFASNAWSEAHLTDQCLELRRSKKRTATSSCACPYYQSSRMATLALHSMATPTDLEDLAQMGQSSRTCAYYATRQALPQAELVIVPYSILLNANTRESVGLNLKNSLVLIDEAHNLPQAIAGMQSCRLPQVVVRAAMGQLSNYTAKYMDRLNAQHLKLLGQLKTLLQGFLRSMTKDTKAADPSVDDNATRLLSPSAYLCENRLDAINLFPLLRYMKEAKLSQKLLGFWDRTSRDGGHDTASSNERGEEGSLSTQISPMSIVETFLTKLTYHEHSGKIALSPKDIQFVVLDPAVHAQDDLYRLPHAVCLVGGTLQPLTVLLQELIPSLVPAATQAQRHFYNPNSVENSLVQGSLFRLEPPQSPQQLEEKQQEHPFVAFTCGHVVSSNNVLLQAVTKVGQTSVDVRHKVRSTTAVIAAIGKALTELAQVVPHGLVVFVPSYKYEQSLVDAWKQSGVWQQLGKIKTIWREPKSARDIPETLQGYKQDAESSRGALLLSVMGGKLSEGINFANDLCRCVVVVGLPYADRSDPLLQEKLTLVSQPTAYYRSLCLRAVNQSVGRAIRHAHDYAAIVVMDARYPRDDEIANGLPRWLTKSTPQWRNQETDLTSVLHRVEDFFGYVGK